MFTKKSFTLTIGNESALLALHDGNTIKNKVLIPSLSNEDKAQLLTIFKNNKSVPIYILLDNSDQTYTNKSYPSVNRFDLKQIIQRHIRQEFNAGENSEDVIHNYMTHRNQKLRLWECMYISSVYFEEMDKWVDFILQEIHNPLIGIYMLPIESVNLVKKLHTAQKNEKIEDLTQDKITLLIIQTKVSGIRQVVYLNEKIIFTRLTQYNHESKDFIVDFEQDIFRTNEYLKRILPNLKMEDIEIINILPRSTLEKIEQIKNNEIHFTNYTPREAAEKIGKTNLIPKNSQYSDILISNVFANSNKILKSVTKRIKKLSIIDTLSKIFVSVNTALLIIVLIYAVFIQIEQSKNQKIMANLTKNKKSAEQELTQVNKQVIGDKAATTDKGVPLQIDTIIDFGKLDEALAKNKVDPIDFYQKLGFISKKDATIKSFNFNNTYSLEGKRSEFKFTITGKIINKSGNVENLFTIYDDLILEANNQFKDFKVESSKLPTGIDFSKKYYDTPFTLTISNN